MNCSDILIVIFFYFFFLKHGTCPVCRIDLNGVDNSLKNDDNLLSELENIQNDQPEPPE